MRINEISLLGGSVIVCCVVTGCAEEQRFRCLRAENDSTQTVIEFNRCLGARVFAARDTSELTPTQSEVDRYYEYMSRAADAEPLIIGLPQSYRALGPGQATVLTSNTAIVAALRDATKDEPVPLTGDSAFDDVMGELVDTVFEGGPSPRGEGLFAFSFYAATFNVELLHERLLPTSSSLPEPIVLPRGDGWWRWLDAEGTGRDDASAEIRSRIGWGDCIVACDGFHEFLHIVPPAGGMVTVYDLGGDPLPPYMQPNPNTKPPP